MTNVSEVVNVHIRVLNKVFKENEELAESIATVIEEKFPNILVYIVDVEEV